MSGEFLQLFLRVFGKGRHLLAVHSEERPQPLCGRCHRAGTGRATLEVIGSKRSYVLKWRKLNSDDDDGSFSCVCVLCKSVEVDQSRLNQMRSCSVQLIF